jgi:hypothetical protein
MKKFYMLSALALMGACAFKPGSEEAKSKTLEIMNSDDSLRAQITPRPEPHEYSVALAWPKVDAGLTLAVRRKEDTGQIRSLDVIPSGQTSYTDHGAQGGVSYTYVLSLIEDNAYQDLASVDVSIPKDLVLAAGSDLPSADHGYHRLFLEQDASYFVRDDAKEIAFAELISKNSKIIIAPKEEVAAPLEIGASISEFKLNLGLGRGVLFVEARGQEGGKGPAGSNGSDGGKGGKGRNGESDYHRECLRVVETFAPGGPDGPRGPCFKNYYCKHQTGDGRQGGRGEDGKRGGQGASGGNSPRVLVKVENFAGFEVKPQAIPGPGGQGGDGGKGGRGGPGGDPGNRDSQKTCREANRGDRGEDGATGALGPRGESGKASPVCLTFGQARFGQCEGFSEGELL